MGDHRVPGRDTMISRRSILVGFGATALVTGLAATAQAQPRLPATLVERRLNLKHLHTGETFNDVYYRNGRYIPRTLNAMNRFLRDHRDNSIHRIDTRLLDFLHDLTGELSCSEPIGIICGYRSPKSNAFLRARSSGVAKRSLHLEGMALDIRVPGTRVRTVAEAALDLRRGGVGKYTGSNFVHIDSGKYRTWGA